MAIQHQKRTNLVLRLNAAVFVMKVTVAVGSAGLMLRALIAMTTQGSV